MPNGAPKPQAKPGVSKPTGFVPETALPPKEIPTYTVQQGDSLGNIASAYGVSAEDIQTANPDLIKDISRISAGHTLKIPGGVRASEPKRQRVTGRTGTGQKVQVDEPEAPPEAIETATMVEARPEKKDEPSPVAGMVEAEGKLQSREALEQKIAAMHATASNETERKRAEEEKGRCDVWRSRRAAD